MTTCHLAQQTVAMTFAEIHNELPSSSTELDCNTEMFVGNIDCLSDTLNQLCYTEIPVIIL